MLYRSDRHSCMVKDLLPLDRTMLEQHLCVAWPGTDWGLLTGLPAWGMKARGARR